MGLQPTYQVGGIKGDLLGEFQDIGVPTPKPWCSGSTTTRASKHVMPPLAFPGNALTASCSKHRFKYWCLTTTSWKLPGNRCSHDSQRSWQGVMVNPNWLHPAQVVSWFPTLTEQQPPCGAQQCSNWEVVPVLSTAWMEQRISLKPKFGYY